MRARALIVAALLVASPALGDRVRLNVVDIAGGRVYLEPGMEKGMRVGDEVEIGGKKYKVVQATQSFCAIDSDDTGITLDSNGTADVDPNRKDDEIKRIEKPPPLAKFTGQWKPARPPAEDQHPKNVPLGAPTSQSQNRLTVWLSGFGLKQLGDPNGSSIAMAEIGMQLHYEPLVRQPLAFDADIRADGYFGTNIDGRAGSSSRPIIRVRELQARYGDEASAFAAAGRLRYASAMLGMLDGVRVQTPSLGGLTLGAFGGFVPDPLNSEPSTQATRFGGELAFQSLDTETRWRAVLGGHASRFGGQTDERRVTALAEVSPRFGHFAAYSELSFFDAQNPWGADKTELSAAGAEAGARAGIFDFNLRAGLQRPERSRWLASYLPPEWLCVAAENPAPGAFCVNNDAVLSAGGDIGMRIDRTELTVGGNGSRTTGTDAEQVALYASSRSELTREFHIQLGATGTRGTFMESAAFILSPGVSLFDDRADLSLRYRPAITRYSADKVAFVEHGVGGGFWFGVAKDFDFSLDADVVTGGDIDFLMAQGIVIWRPEI